MSDVNNKQVGGDHYRSKVQHWDYVELNGLGYLEGCATKYATRNRKKHEDPTQDLEKAVHYAEKAQALHLAGLKRPRVSGRNAVPLRITVEEFAEANNLTSNEEQVVRILTFWQDAADLQTAIELIQDMIAEARG